MSCVWSDPPWYVAGLAFECVGCGRCCAGPEDGYVWATEAEIAAIALHLGVSIPEMYRRHVKRALGRYTLAMEPANKDCPFLSPADGGRRTCRIYPVRPTQCRTWPFWPGNLDTFNDWCHVASKCPGINRGPIQSFQEIQAKAHATRE
jgi:hypothetical protein